MTVKTILKHSGRIAWKDLLELFRNRLGLVLLVVMPLFMMVMVGFIYPTNGTVTDLQIGVVNNDSGVEGQYMSSAVFMPALNAVNDQTHMLVMTDVSSVEDLRDMVQRGQLQGGIMIPANFSSCLVTQQQGMLVIVSDESNPQISATIQASLSGVFDAIGTSVAQQQLNTTNIAVVKPFDVQTQGVDLVSALLPRASEFGEVKGQPDVLSEAKQIGRNLKQTF